MAAKLETGALRALPRPYLSGPPRTSLSRPCRNHGMRRQQARHASSLRALRTRVRHNPSPSSRHIAHPILAIASGRSCRRRYATAPPRNIAVLGGGMTGLTTAYYLTKFLPEAKITLYEATGRLGGWIDTEKVDVRTDDGETGTVFFERGARAVLAQHSLHKWDDLVLYELVDALNLRSRLAVTPSGLRIPRYIYYPDHLVDVTGPYFKPFHNPLGTLVSLLGYLRNFLTEPMYKGFLPSLLNAALNKGGPQTPEQGKPGDVPVVGQPDVSVGDFFLSKFGRRDVVDNILSAVVHGTQGGDVWKLSIASSMFHRFMVQDTLGNTPGTVLALLDDVHVLDDIAKNNQAVRKLAEESANWGYISFKGGFSTLLDAMAVELQNNPNVTVLLNQPVEHVRDHPNQTVEITTSKSREPAYYDKVVSTLFSQTLASLTDNHLPSLADTHAVTISVVNLWYPTPNLNAPYNGFGYLLPQTVPAENNPEAALGVIFDSDREAAQLSLTPDSDSSHHQPQGTKLTVMLGGHHWDGLPDEFLPDSASAISAAKSAVSRQLGIPASEKVGAASAKLCRNCIPQHRVGHAARMAAAREELQTSFGGRLAVAGASYSPPGVLPGLRAGRDVAAQIAGKFRLPPGAATGGQAEQPWSVGDTGLGGITERLWSRWPRGRLPYVGGTRWRTLKPDGEEAGEKKE